MSARFQSASTILYRQGTWPAVSPLTICWRQRIVTDLNTSAVIIQLFDSVSSSFWQNIGLDASGTRVILRTNVTNAAGSDLSVGQWYHLAYVRNGSTHSVYVNGVLDVTLSSSSTFTADTLTIGTNSVNPFNGNVQDLGIWTVAKSQSEIVNEKNSYGSPASSTNLYAFYPLTNNANDASGNSRHLTNSGTTWEANMTIPIVADDVTIAPVSVAAANFSQKHNAVASPINTSSPNVAAASLLQLHKIIATNPSIGPPVLESAALSQRVNATAQSIETSAPEIESASLTLAFSLVAENLEISAPSLDSANLSQNFQLSAQNFTTQAVEVGQASLIENVQFSASDLETTLPLLEAADFKQAHDLEGQEIVAGSPLLEISEIGQTYVLTTLSINGGIFLETALIAQNHSIIAQNVTAGAPEAQNASLILQGVFQAEDIAVTPFLESGSLKQEHVLGAQSLSSQPIVEGAILSESGGFNAESITTTPVVEQAAFNQHHIFGAPDIQTQSPNVEGATPFYVNVLTADSLVIGNIVVENTTLSLSAALTPQDIETQEPTLQQTQLFQRHNLIASILLTGAPTVGKSYLSGGQRTVNKKTYEAQRKLPIYIPRRKIAVAAASRNRPFYEVN